jgi:hypothetical protein
VHGELLDRKGFWSDIRIVFTLEGLILFVI